MSIVVGDMCGDNGAVFAAGSLSTGAKTASLRILQPALAERKQNPQGVALEGEGFPLQQWDYPTRSAAGMTEPE